MKGETSRLRLASLRNRLPRGEARGSSGKIFIHIRRLAGRGIRGRAGCRCSETESELMTSGLDKQTLSVKGEESGSCEQTPRLWVKVNP